MNNSTDKYFDFVNQTFHEFMKLRSDPHVHAVYFKRSEESGRVIYPSFVTKSGRPECMKAVIYYEDDGKYLPGYSYPTTGYEDHNWDPLNVKVFYHDVNQKMPVTLATPLLSKEGFRLFDNQLVSREHYKPLTSYVRSYLEGSSIELSALLTDFPRFDWDHKIDFLNESLNGFPVDRAVIFFAALVRHFAIDYYINVPCWVDDPRYISSCPIGALNTDGQGLLDSFLSHNYYISRNDLERV